MPDETPRRRTNLHDPHLREREEPRSPRLGFTGFQVVVCMLCILAAVGVRMMGGGTLTKVQSAVSQALGNRDAGGQLQTVFRALKAYFPDVKEVFQSAASGTGSSTASASAGSGSSAASGSSTVSASTGSASAATAAGGGSTASGKSAASSAASGGSQTASKTASASSTAASARLPGVTNVRTAGGAV